MSNRGHTFDQGDGIGLADYFIVVAGGVWWHCVRTPVEVSTTR